MAKSYYGYVKRDDTAYVDWASIGKTLSDDLIKTSEARQARRDEIDRQTRETLNAAEKMQQNLPPTSSAYYMDGASNIREALLLAEKQMKSGVLDPREYLKKRQNIMDGIDMLSMNAQQDRDLYAESMKRLQEGKAGGLEIFKNEMLSRYRDPKKTGIFVDPIGYNVVLTEKDKDGRVVADPSKYVSVAAMSVNAKDFIDRYDVVAEVSKNVKPLGDYIKAVRRGGVMSLEDITMRPEYQKAENDVIASMLASERLIGGVLSDYLGYEFTMNPAEASADGKVLVEQDDNYLYQPAATEEQRKEAEEALRAQIRVQLDRKEVAMPIVQQSEASINRGRQVQNEVDQLELLRKLYSGPQREASAAADNIRATNPSIRSIEKDGPDLTITYTDGRIESMQIPTAGSGESSGFEQFATKAGAFLIPDLNIQRTYLDWQNSDYKGRSETYNASILTSEGLGTAQQLLDETGIEAAVFGLGPEQLVPLFDRLVKKLGPGYTVEADTTMLPGFMGGQDKLVIKSPSGETVEIVAGERYEANQVASFMELQNWIDDQLKMQLQTNREVNLDD